MARSKNVMPAGLQAVVAFHGHLCPGLVIGYMATKAALEALGVKRAKDEELIAIVENDACGVDAVQQLAGCTLGKGNLFLRDYGKQVFTFARRPVGGQCRQVEAVRVALRKRRPRRRRRSEGEKAKAALDLLAEPFEKHFTLERVKLALPPAAEIRRSILCAQCGEPTMATRIRRTANRRVCIPCARLHREKAR